MKGSLTTNYNPNVDEYIVKVKKNNWWWLLLLLLLLLPLLLFIPFKKNFDVKTIVAESKTPIPQTDVFFQYIDCQLFNFKTKKFLTKDTITLYQLSDNQALAHFKDIRYTLYYTIFHFNKKSKIYASNNCSFGEKIKRFILIRNKSTEEIELNDRVYNYTFTVLDVQTRQPIPNAKVKAKVLVNGKEKTWQGISGPDGSIYFENFPYCGQYTIEAQADGFNTKVLEGDANELYNEEFRKIWLDQDKQTINFFVKDLYTKDPLPNTKAELIINGQVVQTVYTNVNGMAMSPGEGIFENVRGNVDFTIRTTRAYYADTTRSDNVKNWKQLADSQKVIYMRPLTQTLKFRDVDGSMGVPGAENKIYVNGNLIPQSIYSDGNGYFSIAGIKADDVISIVASKPGYETNDYTIKNKKVSDLLNAPQNKRDIPLRKKQQPTPPPPNPQPQPNPQPNPQPLPPIVYPCESPQESGGQGITERVHSIGNSKKFQLDWDMYSVPDQLIVYCGTGANKRQIFTTRGPVSGKGSATLSCDQTYITIKVIGQQEGTQWQYRMNCNK